MKILLADDHGMIRQGLKLMLTQAYPSSEIVEASDANQLANHINRDDIDIVITDLQMPGPDVTQIIKDLREAGNKVPIIVLSMASVEKNAVRVIRAGSNAYISKDNAPDELIKAMQFVLQKRKYITPEIAELLADSYIGDEHKKPHEHLSSRELTVFQMMAKGKNLSEIGQILSISINTVSTYKTRILEKMNISNKADIIRYAHSNQLV